MVSKAQAVSAHHRQEFHHGLCLDVHGPRGAVGHHREVWRVNGACKVWKTRPEAFSLPIKYGFRGPYSYITEQNAAEFHAAEDCIPVDKYPSPKPLKLQGPMMPLGGGSIIED
jgi:hypothetical protein